MGSPSFGELFVTFFLGFVIIPLNAVLTILVTFVEFLLKLVGARRSKTLKPSTVLITGASSGLGAELAERYAKTGVTLYLTGRNVDALKNISSVCVAKGAKVETKAADLGSQEGRTAFSAWVRERNANLDLVIANAGISESTSGVTFDEIEEMSRRMVETNVSGVHATIYPAIEGMRKRGSGQVAIMSSLAGMAPLTGSAAYAASKSFVKTLGESLRWQLLRDGVSVNVITPGFVDTPLTQKNKFKQSGMVSLKDAGKIIVAGLANDDPVIAFPSSTFILAYLSSIVSPVVRDFIARNKVFGPGVSYMSKSKRSKEATSNKSQ